ncbi:MAG: MFS transporter [Actinomycetaceae bacterium]|nr:MFS transporter [Actinomycetaceae bacterium]
MIVFRGISSKLAPSWAVLIAAALGLAGSALMQTLLANASPRIVSELNAHQWYGLVNGTYLIGSATFLFIGAGWSDRAGQRKMFIAGHIFFATGSLLTAFSSTAFILLFARGLQGVGTGLLAPAGLAAIGMTYTDRSQRGKALSLIAAIQVVANVIGPPLGGWFTDGPGWRWGIALIFPTSLVCIALALTFPNRRAEIQWWRIDLAQQLHLWRSGDIAKNILLAAACGLVGISALTYAPLLLQSVYQASAALSGLLLLPLMVGMGIGAAIAGHLAHLKWVRTFAWIIALAGCMGALIPSLWPAVFSLVLAGMGSGMIFPLLILDVQNNADPEYMAQTGAGIQFGRTAGAAIGVPILSLWIISGLPMVIAMNALFASLALVSLFALILQRSASK